MTFGYKDCKEVYSKLLHNMQDEVDKTKDEINILRYLYQSLNSKYHEEQELIELGQAVKTIIGAK